MDANVMALLTIWYIASCVTVYSVVKLVLTGKPVIERRMHRMEEVEIGKGLEYGHQA